MPADPSSFDHFRRGEPLLKQTGKAGTTSFDNFRRGEVIFMPFLVTAAPGPVWKQRTHRLDRFLTFR